jgi:hypothetical protein
MAEPLDAKGQIQAMLERGWVWRDFHEDVLVHPEDHTLAVRYHPEDNTLSISPELVKALELIIPTPAGKSRRY